MQLSSCRILKGAFFTCLPLLRPNMVSRQPARCGQLTVSFDLERSRSYWLLWAIAVLLIGAVAYFDARPTFLGAFDVSVAPF
jgi:hypothetical protein